MAAGPRPLVLVNPGCNYATGRSRWLRVEGGLRQRINEFQVEEIRSEGAATEQVAAALARGVRCFVAAGGDGTVNLVANALLAAGEQDAVLGAVGLGSSNDFHKPFRRESFIAAMPVRVDFANARPVDVIRVDYGSGPEESRFCLLNASIGITAEANAFFNTRKTVIRNLQRVSQDLAVTAAALRSLFAFRDIAASLTIDDCATLTLPVTNLGIIKRPNFAGSLRYDTDIALDDGRLGINAIYGLSLFGRIGALVALSRCRFEGRPNTLCRHGTNVAVASDREFAVELDGEVVRTRSARFSVVPKAMKVCI